jgi:hypothetical protein
MAAKSGNVKDGAIIEVCKQGEPTRYVIKRKVEFVAHKKE